MQADYCVLHRFLANSAVEKLVFSNPDVKARWPLPVDEEGTSSDLLRACMLRKPSHRSSDASYSGMTRINDYNRCCQPTEIPVRRSCPPRKIPSCVAFNCWVWSCLTNVFRPQGLCDGSVYSSEPQVSSSSDLGSISIAEASVQRLGCKARDPVESLKEELHNFERTANR
jgi:hypothetical protein